MDYNRLVFAINTYLQLVRVVKSIRRDLASSKIDLHTAKSLLKQAQLQYSLL